MTWERKTPPPTSQICMTMTDPTIYHTIAQTVNDISKEAAETFESETFRLIYTVIGTALTGLIGLGTAAIPFFMRRLEVRAEAGKEARDKIQHLLSLNRESRKRLESLIREEVQKCMDIIEDANAKLSVTEGDVERQRAIAIDALDKLYAHLHKIKDTEIQIREKRHDEGG